MGAGSKEVATIEALPDKVNGTAPTKNQPALFTLGEYLLMNSEILKAQLKILRLKILNKNHDVIKY